MLRISEHYQFYSNSEKHFSILKKVKEGFFAPILLEPTKSILYNSNKKNVCLKVSVDKESAKIETSYYIGLDRIQPWNMPVFVEPKVNKENNKLNHISMLLEALQAPENLDHLEGLMEIRFEDEWIEIEGDNSIELTPFLIVQFLTAVRAIVRKGLKKDYYRVRENLTSKVKGKILVGQQIRQNVVRNNLTKTVCEYQDFGINTEVNQFLKYVLQFVQVKLETGSFSNDALTEMLRFNMGAFHSVSHKQFYAFHRKETNPFYREYNVAIQLGNQLLKLLDHNLSKASLKNQKYPPHWIDMSKLFELYVFKKLRDQYTGDNEVTYHFKTHHQELDFIINTTKIKAVVDAKYKPRYSSGNPSKDDARQLAGYSRLTSVYKELEIDANQLIDVYFIYPKELKKVVEPEKENKLEDFDDPIDGKLLRGEMRVSKAYRRMYMQEVELPISFIEKMATI